MWVLLVYLLTVPDHLYLVRLNASGGFEEKVSCEAVRQQVTGNLQNQGLGVLCKWVDLSTET